MGGLCSITKDPGKPHSQAFTVDTPSVYRDLKGLEGLRGPHTALPDKSTSSSVSSPMSVTENKGNGACPSDSLKSNKDSTLVNVGNEQSGTAKKSNEDVASPMSVVSVNEQVVVDNTSQGEPVKTDSSVASPMSVVGVNEQSVSNTSPVKVQTDSSQKVTDVNANYEIQRLDPEGQVQPHYSNISDDDDEAFKNKDDLLTLANEAIDSAKKKHDHDSSAKCKTDDDESTEDWKKLKSGDESDQNATKSNLKRKSLLKVEDRRVASRKKKSKHNESILVVNYAESIGDKIKKYRALHKNLNDLEKCVSVCKDASVAVQKSLLSCGISEEELDKIEADVDSDSSPQFFSVGSSEVDEAMEGARKNLFETFGVVGNTEQEAELVSSHSSEEKSTSSFKSPKTKSSCSAKSSEIDKSNETHKKDCSRDSSKTPDRSSKDSSYRSRDSSKTSDNSSRSRDSSKTAGSTSSCGRDSSKTRDVSSKGSSSSKTTDVSSKGSSSSKTSDVSSEGISSSKTSDVSSKGSSLSKTSDVSSKGRSSSKTSDVSLKGNSSSKTSDVSSKGSSLSKTPDVSRGVPSETSHKDTSSSKKDKTKHTPIQDLSKKHRRKPRRKPSRCRDSSVSSVEVITIDSDSDAEFDTLIADDEVDITKVKVELNEAIAEGDKKESPQDSETNTEVHERWKDQMSFRVFVVI